MNKERDEALIEALYGSVPQANPQEWVTADHVARHAKQYGVTISALGAGRVLSRLAREGRILMQPRGYMNRYAHPRHQGR